MPLRSVSKKTCSVEGCDNNSHCRGWCHKHYKRWQIYGDPLTTLNATQDDSIEDRLLAGIERVTESGCWIWMGALDSCGYGQIGIAGVNQGPHRVSFETFIGTIPTGLCVLHRCDLPCCINPSHLFIGTHQDNTDDKMKKGREAVGERNGMTVLRAAQVIEIKQALLSYNRLGFQKELAEKYMVCKQTIGNIKTGKTWSHIKLEDLCVGS